MTDNPDFQVRAIVRETVHETLISMGLNPNDLDLTRRDFMFLTDLRRSTETVKKQTMISAMGILMVGALGALWLGI